MPGLDTLAATEAAIAEEEALLATHLARLAERRAERRDAATAEILVRVGQGRLVTLREHRAWLLARRPGKAGAG